MSALCYSSATSQKNKTISKHLRIAGDAFFHSLICSVVTIAFFGASNYIAHSGFLSLETSIVKIISKILQLISFFYVLRSSLSFIDGFQYIMIYFNHKHKLQDRKPYYFEHKKDEELTKEFIGNYLTEKKD